MIDNQAVCGTPGAQYTQQTVGLSAQLGVTSDGRASEIRLWCRSGAHSLSLAAHDYENGDRLQRHNTRGIRHYAASWSAQNIRGIWESRLQFSRISMIGVSVSTPLRVGRVFLTEYSFGWTNASYSYDLTVINEKPKKALALGLPFQTVVRVH